MLKIGEVAQTTGLTIETIRFYEAEGLIASPLRSGGNYRLYGQVELDRLSFIKRSRDLGFTMDEVRELLKLADDPSAPCRNVDAIAQRHVDAINKKMKDLKALRAGLVQMIDCCDGTTVADCRIIETLSPRL